MKTGASVFFRSDGRWEARYQKGRNDAGKIQYGFVYGLTKEEAEKKRVDAIRKLNSNAIFSTSNLASTNPNISFFSTDGFDNKKLASFKGKFHLPLDEATAKNIDLCFLESTEPCSIAFFLCLHLGLSSFEAVALSFEDIDLENRIITVNKSATNLCRKLVLTPINSRTIPMTNEVYSQLMQWCIKDKKKSYFVFNNSPKLVESSKTIETKFRKIIKAKTTYSNLSSGVLRSTFIRRCLEANMNIETVCALTGANKSQLYRFFGGYIKADITVIKRLDNFDHERKTERKQLNLLIIGAGSHGHGVKETAERLGVFQSIKFLDDSITGEDIIGKCSDYIKFYDEFPVAFVAFGNNELRRTWTKKLREARFMLPRLIHPNTMVSNNVEIGEGSIIMAQATVNSGAFIGESCIIAPNSMIGFDCNVGSFSHIDCGGIVMKGVQVPEMSVIESGSVYRNWPHAVDSTY